MSPGCLGGRGRVVVDSQGLPLAARFLISSALAPSTLLTAQLPVLVAKAG